MALGTATIEMESPEEHRERLHELVKATRAVLVLSCGHDDRIVGQPMVLLRTGDDTTMYVATALDADQVATLSRDPRVTVVVPGAGCAMFEAEAAVSRDRDLLDAVPAESWRLWGHGKADPSIVVLVISPIEGAYWNGARRHSYLYRLVSRVTSDDAASEPRGPSDEAAIAPRTQPDGPAGDARTVPDDVASAVRALCDDAAVEARG